MKTARLLLTSMTGLRRNLLRATLTTLGIMIGVAAVIAMVEIGQGSAKVVAKTISSMGSNTLLIIPGTAASGGVSFGAGSVMTLTPQDAEALIREATTLRAVAPIVRTRGQVVYGNKNWVPSSVTGTTPTYLQVQNWEGLTAGEMFTEQDVRNASKVCVIGATIVKELFDGESPIGKDLRVQNVALKVVGVLSSKGANMMGMDQDDIILAPWTTIKSRISGTSTANTSQATVSTNTVNSISNLYPSTGLALYPAVSENQTANTPLTTKLINIDQIMTSAKSAEDIPVAIDQINEIIRNRHNLRTGEENDFSVRDMSQMIKAMTSTTALMTKLLLCVAMISLLVGGVGIMNIMLVSVTERTREIGLRMAVGARAKDILLQFLAEAIVLCLLGGAIGIAFGRIISILITTFLQWPTQMSVPAILAAVIVSASVGIIFGFYPAWKASKLDPIEALRYE